MSSLVEETAVLRPTPEPYRRRIELRPSGGSVAAAMEDYMHHVVLRLEHDGEVVSAVEAGGERLPWSSCPEGVAGLALLAGVPLARVAAIDGWMGGRTSQCVHGVDLAVLAAAAARRGADRTYEVWATGIGGPRLDATLHRDGERWATWRIDGLEVVAEERFAGLMLDRRRFSEWVGAHLGPDDAEAAFVLRRATVIGLSRGVDTSGWVHPIDARPADDSCATYGAPHVREATVTVRPRATDRDGLGAPIPVAGGSGVSSPDPAA